MYQIEIFKNTDNQIFANYTIDEDLITFTRHSYIKLNDKWETINIDMAIDEFLEVAEKIKLRSIEHINGIKPPEDEESEKQTGYGLW